MRNIRILIWSFSIVSGIALIIYCYFLKNLYISTDKADVWGQFGDYIGGVLGTIVAAFTGILLVLTLNSQNKTKNDNFFYYLIQLNENHIQKMYGKFGSEKHTGKEFLKRLVEECRIKFHIYSNETKVKETLAYYRPTLSSYLSNNNELINFINYSTQDIPIKYSVNFKKIYLAQFTNDEKIIIGYLIHFGFLERGSNLSSFYLKHKIKNTIDYELDISDAVYRPDAIKEILDKI